MKLRRSDRMVVISNYLLNHPYELTSLNTFAEKYEDTRVPSADATVTANIRPPVLMMKLVSFFMIPLFTISAIIVGSINAPYTCKPTASTIAKHCHTYGFIYFSNLNIQSFPFNNSF